FIFHPHGWSSPAQFVEFIDYAVAKHGKKVKFLTFREAQERLDRNLLNLYALRWPQGEHSGIRLLDVNNDGYVDVLQTGASDTIAKLWDVQRREWNLVRFPLSFQW